MQIDVHRPSRRLMLARAMGLVGGLTLALLVDTNTRAEAKAAKSDFLYQDRPRDGKGCGQCKFFSPVSEGATTGTCAIVEGVIDRNGWCLAFSPRT